jgi:hypothetical protein
MCGKFLIASAGEALQERFRVPALRLFQPRYNVAFTPLVPALAADKAGLWQYAPLR